MKWYKLIVFFLLFSELARAKIGCIDNSKHLSELYDNKEYHFVQCNCPCTNTIADRNKCIKCFHFHLPESLFFTSSVTHNTECSDYLLAYPNVETFLGKLIVNYKENNADEEVIETKISLNNFGIK